MTKYSNRRLSVLPQCETGADAQRTNSQISPHRGRTFTLIQILLTNFIQIYYKFYIIVFIYKTIMQLIYFNSRHSLRLCLHCACTGGLTAKSSGLVLGRRPLGAVLHSSNEPRELSQWLCHNDSTTYSCLGDYYYYPPFASIAKGEVFCYPPFARQSEGRGICFTVCFFVCSVNDFSATREPIHAIFCMRAQPGSGRVFSPFGGWRPPAGGKRGK